MPSSQRLWAHVHQEGHLVSLPPKIHEASATDKVALDCDLRAESQRFMHIAMCSVQH